MKKPIQAGMILTGSCFCAILIYMIGINFFPKEQSKEYDTDNSSRLPLVLANQIKEISKEFSNPQKLWIHTQFVDSIILEPSEKPYIKVSGDKTLVDNLKIVYEPDSYYLLVLSKKLYKIKNDDRGIDYYYLPGSLAKGGLVFRIGFKSLSSIRNGSSIKKIIQKGVLKTEKLTIELKAEEAYFNIQAHYLNLDLQKPNLNEVSDSISETQYKTRLKQLTQSKLHQIKGKIDIVEVAPLNFGNTLLDLSELTSRHVHADLYNGGPFNKLIAAPTQLLSCITPKKLPDLNLEIICKSKAKVTKAYRSSYKDELHRYP
jgi:hypothetical protein